jgi:hypothetical protein
MARTDIRSAVRSEAMARNAARDGAVGAALGLLLVSGLVAANLDTQQMMANSGAPLSSLMALVGVVVAQCALGASLCGAALRKFSSLD